MTAWSRGLRCSSSVDADINYVLSVDIVSVEQESAAVRAGTTMHFGIHRPAQMLVDDSVGKTIDFDAVWIACGGAFRRFDELRRRFPGDFTKKFEGWLEVGDRFRAEVRSDPKEGFVLAVPLHAPVHH